MVYSIAFQEQFKSTNQKRRRFVRYSVLQITDNIPFPPNFLTSFLRNTDSKHDLVLYLPSKIVSIHSDVGNTHLLLCATHHNFVISFPPAVNDTISSTAKEADQKIIRHALHCIKVRYSFIEIQSIDTDVLILLLAYIAMKLVSNNDSFNYTSSL